MDIFGHAKEGVPEFRTVNDLASLSFHAIVPKPGASGTASLGGITLAAQPPAALTALHVAITSFFISSGPGGTTVSPNNPDRKILMESPKGCIVEAVRGDVQVKRSGQENWEPLKEGDTVREGDQIKAGARSAAVLICGGTIVLRVHANSSLTLTDIHFDKEKLKKHARLDVGSVFIETRDDRPKEVKVMTPHGTAVVRGTLFKVGHDPEAKLSEVVVVKGVVEVETLPTGKNKMTITGPGSCEKGGLRVTIDKDENISQPQAVTIDRSEWKHSGIDLCAMGG